MDSKESSAEAVASVVAGRGPHLDGLTVRRRQAQVSVASGSRVGVRVVTDAHDPVTGRHLSWPEAYVLDTAGAAATVRATQIPLDRIAALRAGRGLRWPAPSSRPSTRVAAAAVRLLARVGGAAASDPVDVVARYVEEFKNQSRFAVFPRLFAADFHHHFDFPGRGPGFDSFMSVGRDLLGAFTQLHVTVEDLFGQDELVVESNTVRAVHSKPFAGAAASRRPVTWTEIHIYRVVDGRIVENWPSVDVERIVGSLG